MNRQRPDAERINPVTKKTTPKLRPALLPAGILWGLLVALAGCGGDDNTDDNVQYGGTLPDAAPREVRHEGMTETDYGDLDRADIGLHIPWAQNPISRDPVPDAPLARLTDVTANAMDGFDRVTFTFEPRMAGYQLRLVEGGGGGCDGTEPGTDAAVQLAIEFPRTVANDGGTPLVGTRDLAPDLPTLVRAVQTCDEDDKVRWLVGARGETEYRLLEVRMGNQVVVDLRSTQVDSIDPEVSDPN